MQLLILLVLHSLVFNCRTFHTEFFVALNNLNPSFASKMILRLTREMRKTCFHIHILILNIKILISSRLNFGVFAPDNYWH